jgi:hypothetical protein
MRKLITLTLLILSLILVFASCDKITQDDGVILVTVEDGYLAINGVKTEHKVESSEKEEPKEDAVTVEDGYLVVNGKKTEYKVDTAAVVEVVDGYLVVDGK